MDYPKLDEALRLERLTPLTGKVRMVLDTDTYNEIDDQFAVVQALLSPDKLSVEAIYAAPFDNSRSAGPGDGMEKSYEEILRLLERLEVSPEGLVFRGSMDILRGDEPQESAAVDDLIAKSKTGDGPLYVVAIGAITNVASAILKDPSIIERIVVVWLGGHAHYWPTTREFNLQGDVVAAQVVFDRGVPLVQIPCHPVASHLLTTLAELECFVKGRGAIGDYLVEIFTAYSQDHFAHAKVIWDISAVAWLLDASWVPSDVVHSPVLTVEKTWSHDPSRHFIRVAREVRRDAIFRDLFEKLERRAG
ncbi:MAG: nucleoside hydrolase [Candidatus Latescibacterota bacterium]|nr:nucleoside hydrolase [Candidatus Latescibacterota bacterium]